MQSNETSTNRPLSTSPTEKCFQYQPGFQQPTPHYSPLTHHHSSYQFESGLVLPSLVRVYSYLDASGKAHTIIRAKSSNELNYVNASGAAELSLQILSFLEQGWIDTYRVNA